VIRKLLHRVLRTDHSPTEVDKGIAAEMESKFRTLVGADDVHLERTDDKLQLHSDLKYPCRIDSCEPRINGEYPSIWMTISL